MLEQHPDSARPTVRTPRKVSGLLIKYFAGSSIDNLDYNVVVGLGNSPHDSKQRLFGAGLEGNAGLAAPAIAQRFRPADIFLARTGTEQ